MALTIGKYIRYALSAAQAPALNAVVGGRVFPVVVPDDELTNRPYIWYYSQAMSEAGTKDGIYSDTAVVNIEVVASSYETMLDVLELVRAAMKNGMAEWNAESDVPYLVCDQVMSAGDETWDDVDQSYSRTLTYTIETE